MVQLNLNDTTSTYEVDGISDYHRWISQKKLAELLNVSSMTIYRWVKRSESASNNNSQIDCETIMENGNQCSCISIATVAKK